MFDTIIQGGLVIDGSGAARHRADVAVQGDRMVAVGDLSESTANRRIDARGKIVAPGFIDVHNHSDGHLLRETQLACKTTQGFTTELLMSDGISYAPVNRHTWREWLFYLRGLNGLRLDEYSGWETLGDYMALLDKTNVQNSAAQVAYANVRSLACGFGRSAIDDFQNRQIQFEITQAMEQGAVGLSSGLDYIVQCFSTTRDVVNACKAIAPFNGIYATHVRYKLGLLPALEEAFEIAQRAEVRLHISHLKAQSLEETDQVMELLDAWAPTVDYSFDVYPYQPGSTMLSYLVPYEVWEAGPLAAANRLMQPEMLERFRLGLESYRLDLNEIHLAWIPGKDNARHQGKPLSEYIAETGLPAEEALARLLVEERFAPLLVFIEGENKRVEPFLKHERFMMGSDGIYFADGPIHPRVFGSTSRLLGHCVRDRNLFSLEEAVHKMTQWPAQRFGFTDRGEIREGAFADIVLFDPETVADRATFENPHQTSAGISEVLINGCLVVQAGSPVSIDGELPGRYLARCES